MIVKARKIYKCVHCNGNIQKGEKHEHIKLRLPVFDANEKQTGVEYQEYRYHNKKCFPRLLHFTETKKILKNCNFGKHSPNWNTDPDDYDGIIYCKWCGIELKSVENPAPKN